VAEDQPDSYFQLNLDFHARLIAVAGNPELALTYEGTVKQLLLMRRRGLVQAQNIRVSNAEHRRIVDALVARDPDAADTAMRDHVDSGFRRLIDAA
jgi:DNA-binding GntR family transcriptional regulator